MTPIRLAGPALAAALALTAAPALAGSADGKWDCNAFNTNVASLGVTGTSYILANRNGPSGSGRIAYSDGDANAFFVLDGPLLDSLSVVGGTAGDKTLALQAKTGDHLACKPRS